MKGHVRKLANGRWIARFPVTKFRSDGSIVRAAFKSETKDSKREASEWLLVQNTQHGEGSWVDPRKGAESVYSAADSWLTSRRNVADSTLSRDGSYLRNLILPHLGAYELRHLSVEVLDDWIAKLEDDGYSPATIRKAHQLVAQILDRAVAMRKIVVNPAKVGDGVTLPAMRSDEMRFLTVAELDDLAGAIDPDYRPLVLTSAYTGMRWGETAGLKAKHLDLGGGKLTVSETLSEVDGALSFKQPKTPASRRTIALPAVLIDVLTDHLFAAPVVGNGLVFSDSEGGPLRRSNFRRRYWRPAVAQSVGEPMRFHDLRHTHAAWLIAQGEHPKTIQARLGHASISTTLDRYGHLMKGLDEAAAGRLDEMVSDARKHSGSTAAAGDIVRIDVTKAETSK